jgi:hypothetical protein
MLRGRVAGIVPAAIATSIGIVSSAPHSPSHETPASFPAGQCITVGMRTPPS